MEYNIPCIGIAISIIIVIVLRIVIGIIELRRQALAYFRWESVLQQAKDAGVPSEMLLTVFPKDASISSIRISTAAIEHLIQYKEDGRID